MTVDRLASLCEEKFGTPVEIPDFEAKHPEKSPSGEILKSWPRHLVWLSERRLQGCREHGADPDLIRELGAFVERLQAMPEDAILWIWQARSAGMTFGGWADQDEIIFGLQGSNIEPDSGGNP